MCRRAVLADAMGEGLDFNPSTDCNGMCDVCSGEAESAHSQLVRTDMTAYATHVVNTLSVIQRNGIKRDVTFAQLVEASRSVGPLWKSIAALPSTQADAASLRAHAKASVQKLPKEEWGRIVMWLILEGVLEEAFIANAYSFNSYLVANARSAQKLGTGEQRFVIPVPPTTVKTKQKTVAKPASGANAARKRRSSADNGGGKKKKKKQPVSATSSASSSSSAAAIVVLDSSDDDDDFEDF